MKKSVASKPAVKRISRTKAIELIEKSGGRFITVGFLKNKGDERVINGRFVSLTKMGYIKVNENKTKTIPGGIKSVNAQNLKTLSCNSQVYKIV